MKTAIFDTDATDAQWKLLVVSWKFCKKEKGAGLQTFLHLHFQNRLHRLLHHRQKKILLLHQNGIHLPGVHCYQLNEL